MKENQMEWAVIIARYSIEFAIELAKMIETNQVSSQDFIALKTKYGSQKADDYLKAAESALTPKPNP